MIKALVTIIDTDTGIIYDKDKLIPPQKVEFDGYVDVYSFMFEFARANDNIFGAFKHNMEGEQD